MKLRPAKIILIFLLIGLLCSAALAEEETSGTFVLPKSQQAFEYRLTDEIPDSRISFEKKNTATINLPQDTKAVVLEWYEVPKNVSVLQMKADGTELKTEEQKGLLEQLVRLEPDCSALQLDFKEAGALSEVRFLSAEEAEAFEEMSVPEKVDMLVVLAHTADETMNMPGLLANYSKESGISTMVVYMCSQNREQRKEAMEVNRLYGQYNQPEFFDNTYRVLENNHYNEAGTYFPENASWENLVRVIRKYKPEVVVAQAQGGTTQDCMNLYTAQYLETAIEFASAGNKFKSSLEEYGTWDVKKFYCMKDDSMSETVATTVVDWNTELQSAGGKTGMELAQEGIRKYWTLATYNKQVPQDKLEFVLKSSQVGEDTEGNNLLENIPTEELVNKGVKPTFESVPSQAATEVLTEEAAVNEEVAAEEKQDTVNPVIYVIPAAGFVLGLILFFVLKKAGKKWLMLLALLPILLADGLTLYLTMGNAVTQETEEMVAAAEATEEPVVEETEETKAAVDNTYFLNPGEEEIATADTEKGVWEYRSDILYIHIDKHVTTKEDGNPLVYYVADIRMNGVDAYRCGYGMFSEDGTRRNKPWVIARNNKAVLAITGDNMINMETSIKGTIIRSGRLYWKGNGKATCMALTHDMEIKMYEPTSTAQEILEDGIQTTYGFTPVLVNDGEINPKTKTHALKRLNPRTGLGMVEPGHYIAIVADGRQKGYSVGLTLEEFAQMFIDYGCVTAGNLDGGVSAGMIFMGEHINQHGSSDSYNFGSQRAWTDAVCFGYSENVPTVDDVIINTGNKDETKRNKERYLAEEEADNVN